MPHAWCRDPGESIARLRDGEFEIGGAHSGQSVRRHAVHQRDRGDRHGARGGDGAAGVGPRRATSGEGRAVGIASGNGGDHQIFGTMVIEA